MVADVKMVVLVALIAGCTSMSSYHVEIHSFEVEGAIPAAECAALCFFSVYQYREDLPTEGSPRWIDVHVAWDAAAPSNERLYVALGSPPSISFHGSMHIHGTAEGESPLEVNISWNYTTPIILGINRVCPADFPHNTCALVAQDFHVSGSYERLVKASS